MDKAKFIVWNYINDHLDKSDPKVEFDVYEVWHCYILGNEKWLLSSTLSDGMYYEVTYNADKNEFYLDAYKKFQNCKITSEAVAAGISMVNWTTKEERY